MKKYIVVTLAVLVFLVAPLIAPADALTFTYGTTYNGTSPTSTPPWLTAVFTNAGANIVQLTMTASLNVASEFITDVAFNVDPSMVATLGVVRTGGTGTGTFSVGIGENTESIGGPGTGFDILFTFPTGNAGPNPRWDGVETEIYTFTASGLVANSFNFLNPPPAHGAFTSLFTVAKVQGIPFDGTTTSGDITNRVPEPSTLLLFGSGLAGLGIMRRKQRK